MQFFSLLSAALLLQGSAICSYSNLFEEATSYLLKRTEADFAIAEHDAVLAEHNAGIAEQATPETGISWKLKVTKLTMATR